MGIINEYLNSLRHEFLSQKLDVDAVAESPIEQLEKWIEEAVNSQILEPHAMTLSTVGQDDQPHSRVVYLREIRCHGLVFYTNYQSLKGADLEFNPRAALLFFYAELERQIRIEGYVEKLSTEASDIYFASRPLESKLGAWASAQSETITDRHELLERMQKYQTEFGNDIPRPPHWGGYLLKPARFEFWQGRPARLHDRICYTLRDNSWLKSRLAP